MVPKLLSFLLCLIKLLHIACGERNLRRPRSSSSSIGKIALPSCLLTCLLVLLVNLMIAKGCQTRALRFGLELFCRRLQACSSSPGFWDSPASFRLRTSLVTDRATHCDASSPFVIVEILSARHFVFDSRKLNEFLFNYNRSWIRGALIHRCLTRLRHSMESWAPRIGESHWGWLG